MLGKNVFTNPFVISVRNCCFLGIAAEREVLSHSLGNMFLLASEYDKPKQSLSDNRYQHLSGALSFQFGSRLNSEHVSWMGDGYL